MKILMLGWELPPFNSGGLGVACYYLCQRLAHLGVDIDFVMPYDLPADHAIDFMQVHGVLVMPRRVINAYANWSAEMEAQQTAYHQKIVTLVRKNNYDAIHAHDWLTFKAGMLAKQLTGRPLVAHVHSTEFDRAGAEQGNPVVHDIERSGLLMADRIIVVSNATKTVLVDRYDLPASSIEVIHNASDPAVLLHTDPAANAYTYLERMKSLGYKVVVSIARLTIQKGMSHLLRAAQKAIQLDPKLLFLIVGDGDQRDELIALSAELDIADHVIFTGFLRGKQWRDSYHIGDIFVMSSVSEPFGLTALEAASTGNAVLLTKQSGVSEVLRSAMTYDFWDINKLADNLVNIASEPVLRDTLASNAKTEVASMSWQKAANSLIDTYQTLRAAA